MTAATSFPGDTGIGTNSDDYTSDKTPTFTGVAEAGSLVRLYAGQRDGGRRRRAPTPRPGPGASPPARWPTACTTITATATDLAGNTSLASSGSVDHDRHHGPGDAGRAGRSTAASDSFDGGTSFPGDTGIGTNSDDYTNDKTCRPSTGVAEAGSLVRLYANGTEVGDVRAPTPRPGPGASPPARWPTACTRSRPRPPIWRATRRWPLSSGLSITIDTTAPATPAAPDVDGRQRRGFDGGTSFPGDTGIGTNSDDYTSDKTPTFTGVAEARSLVRLYANGTEVGDVRADATTGAWSIASSTLADGVYTITATATDLAGNTSLASSGLSITIDTTAPATPARPTLTAASDSFDGGTSFPGDTGIGTNSDDYTCDKTPTFTGVAEAGSLVRLYANGTEVGDVRARRHDRGLEHRLQHAGRRRVHDHGHGHRFGGQHVAGLQRAVDHDRHHGPGDAGRADVDGRQRQL